jgi:hypothetical protein
MTGVIATLAAVAVITTLMVIGIRMKLAPPDPDWRHHLPPPVPRPPRWWVVLWLSRYAFLLAGVVAAALGRNRLAVWLALMMVAITFVGVSFRVRVSLRHRREWQRKQQEGPASG